MKALLQDIMALDMQRIGKKLATAAILLFLIGTGCGIFLLWPQLGEAWKLLTQGSEPLAWRFEMLEDTFEWSLAGYDGGLISAVPLGVRTALVVIAAIFAVMAAVYWIFVALWLYQAATRAGLGGTLWLLLGLIANLAAVALFLAVRSLLAQRCERCGGWSLRNDDYCRHCGAALSESCPACGKPLASGDHFCAHCGQQAGQ